MNHFAPPLPRVALFFVGLWICVTSTSCGPASKPASNGLVSQPAIQAPAPIEPVSLETLEPEPNGETVAAIVGEALVEEDYPQDDVLEDLDIDAAFLRPDLTEHLLNSASHHHQVAKAHWSEGERDAARTEADLAMRALVLMPPPQQPEQSEIRDQLRLDLSRLIVTMHAETAGPVGNSTELPLVMNDYVMRELKSFQKGERRFFLESFERSGAFMPMIQQKLAEHNLPEEIGWLPLIESGFKVRALSRARALGIWQFIPSTGYRFGLKRDSWVDERMNPEKATDAAIAYLTQLHQLFGDWSTALAAYNCGEGNVARAIRRQKVNYLDDFWDLFPYLPYETARYVPRFFATLHIIRDPQKWGFVELGPPAPRQQYDSVDIRRQVHLKTIAPKLGLTYAELANLNPALRHGVTPPRSYPLRVPTNQGETLAAIADTLPKYKLSTTATASRYRVRRGDTLSQIARRFRVSVRSIVRLNRLRSQHFLRAGQVLKIPQRGA